MDGNIALHSMPGKGTTFSVYIPVSTWYAAKDPPSFAPLCASVKLRSSFQGMLLSNQLRLLGVRIVEESYQAADQAVCFVDSAKVQSRFKATVHVVSLTSANNLHAGICLTKPLHLGKVINCLERVLHKPVIKQSAPEGVSAFAELRVLLVDDNLINIKIACRMLERAGVRYVDSATTGKEGLEKLERSLSEARPFSLILMDFNMPEMDGPTATHKVRTEPRFSQLKDIPILGWTALPHDQALKECMDCGMSGVLVKPSSMDSLKAALRQFCQL